jgi:hypothetical protein
MAILLEVELTQGVTNTVITHQDNFASLVFFVSWALVIAHTLSLVGPDPPGKSGLPHEGPGGGKTPSYRFLMAKCKKFFIY